MTGEVSAASGAAPSTPPPVESPAPARKVPARAWAVAGGLGLLTLLTRLPGLDRPGILVFDEVYYASQGLEVADRGVEQGHTVHPPFGKWLLAAGIRVFGFRPFGWRVVPLLAGAVVVVATVVAAHRLLGRLVPAAVAGVVVLTDGIAFTTGRLALLDGLLAAFTTVALAAVASAVARPLDVALRRRTTWVSAVMLGAGLATKWSAGPLVLVAGAALVALAWRAAPDRTSRRREVARTALVIAAVPVCIYAATYVPTIVAFPDSAIGRELCSTTGDCDPSVIARLTAVVRDQRAVLRFHEGLDPTNRYAHSAASWVFQTEPVGYLKSRCPSPDPVCSPTDRPSVRRVIGVGNPMVWAAGTLALIVVTVLALWRLDLRLGLVPAWAAALWLPWVVRPRLAWWPFEAARAGYSFYAAPLVPVIGLALACALAEARGRWRPALTACLVAIALLGAAALYPTWTARPTDPGYLAGLVDR